MSSAALWGFEDDIRSRAGVSFLYRSSIRIRIDIDEEGSKGAEQVTNLLRRRLLRCPTAEIAVREHPDKGPDIVGCFVHDPLRGVHHDNVLH